MRRFSVQTPNLIIWSPKIPTASVAAIITTADEAVPMNNLIFVFNIVS